MAFGRSAAVLQRSVAIGLLALLMQAAPVAAQPPAASTLRPGWGFNWRLKERASCRLIDTSVLPSCSRCREVPNAYQSGIDAQACYLVPRFEYVIFPSESDCRTGLELMKRGNR